jgi:hypothetical protein
MDGQHRLNQRSRGWLRYLHRRTMTPDDWSSRGKPAVWWDDLSTPPVLNFPRFDLSESSYAIPMMADVTPAWREVYVDVMDGLVTRHTTHWAAIDWLTQIGHDPDRAHYPETYIKRWIPPHLVGDYDMPGWTANGIEPWGLAPDPIAAEGNLFFKGWFNLMLGFHGYVSRDRKWNEPFNVTGLNDTTYSWTHDGITALLARQWSERPIGPHCENTKIWPYCLSAAALGLQMHDILTGNDDHWVFDRWLEIVKQRFLGISSSGRVEWTALYYDPIVDYLHKAGPTSGLSMTLYLLPQSPLLAEMLYRTAVDEIGWSDPSRPIRSFSDPRLLLLSTVLAREFGDDVTYANLTRHAEENFQPGFFGGGADDFGWGFGLDEPFPRGQLNALLMMADVGAPGAWGRVFTQPNLAKFDEPTVSGVGFPSFGIDMAYNDAETGILHVGTYPATASLRGRPTTFQISQLPDTSACTLRCDGGPFERWRPLDAHTIDIDIDIGDHEFQIFPYPPTSTGTPSSEERNIADTHGWQSRVGIRESPRLDRSGSPADRGTTPDFPAGRADLPVSGVPRPPCACC